MRVLFDMTPAISTFGGNRTYCVELQRVFDGLDAAVAPNLSYHKCSPRLRGVSGGNVLNAVYRDLLRFHLCGPGIFSLFDVVHSTGVPVFSSYGRHRHIITLHDMAPFDTPWRYSWWHRTYFKDVLIPSLQKCDAIICNSAFTRDRALNWLPGLGPRMFITHLAPRSVAPVFTEKLLKLPVDYLLVVGSSDPGKNLDLVCKSVSYAKANGIPLPPVVYIGSSIVGAGDKIDTSGFICLNRLSDEELAYVYSRARILLFPSLYEGFGLPVLEAMQHGIPVVSLRIPAVVEVAGQAAVYCDNSPSSMISVIARLLGEVNYYDDCAAGARERSKIFCWKKCAISTLDIYRSI